MLRANPGGMAQQHTGPQLQLICILVVLHGSCHTGHLHPSLAALALAEGAAVRVRTQLVWGDRKRTTLLRCKTGTKILGWLPLVEVWCETWPARRAGLAPVLASLAVAAVAAVAATSIVLQHLHLAYILVFYPPPRLGAQRGRRPARVAR